MKYDALFKPIKIGSIEIQNRFVVPAMDSGFATEEHKISERGIQYYAARARGGYGLIVTELMGVDAQGITMPNQIGLWDDCFIDNLKELTAEIHKVPGVKIFAQIQHGGMVCIEKNIKTTPIGPSSIPAANYLEKIREMSNEEVYEMVNKFAAAALRSKKAGFDGVELQGGHGYLVAQFLSKAFNKRVDEFGGSYHNRFHFAELLIQAIKKTCGKDFPLSIRLSANEFLDGGNTPEDLKIYASLAEKAGVDCISITTGTGIGGNVVTPIYVDPGFNLPNVAAVKREVSVPVIGVGRINDPDIALHAVESGETDLLALGRQSIADSSFVNKLREGRVNEIFKCTGCMQRCYYGKTMDEDDVGVSCIINPFSGKEALWKITEAENKKKIVIVGTGPAGLQAAWILAKRGHTVIVMEKQATPGGNYKLAAVPPKKQDLAQTIVTYTTLCKKYGVTLKYNCKATAETLEAQKPDEVIMATGAEPFVPPIPGIHAENVVAAESVLKGETILSGMKVAVLGGGLVGCDTAEFLSLYHNNISIIEMDTQVAKEMVRRSKTVLMQRLKESNVRIYTDTRVCAIEGGSILVNRSGEEKTLDGFDAIVMAFGYKSYRPLQEDVENASYPVHYIGDALKGGDAKVAIYGATKLALQL